MQASFQECSGKLILTNILWQQWQTMSKYCFNKFRAIFESSTMTNLCNGGLLYCELSLKKVLKSYRKCSNNNFGKSLRL